jgi:hypothetical protein
MSSPYGLDKTRKRRLHSSAFLRPFVTCINGPAAARGHLNNRVVIMTRIFSGCLIVTGLASSLLAVTPDVQQQIGNPYYSVDQYQLAHSMFDHIRADLDRAGTNAYSPRVDTARLELERLAHNWDQARYHTREFDRTMAAVQMVVNDNGLTPKDRDELSADVSRLLEFRSEYY